MSAEDVQSLLDGYTWCAVTTDAPEWLVFPLFRELLGDESAFEKINEECPLSCPPNLLETLKSATPPSLDFFRSLPDAPPKVWGIYLELLKKPGCPPGLYVGSGTRKVNGVQARFKDYDEGKHPRLVQSSLDKGYIRSRIAGCCAGVQSHQSSPSALCEPACSRWRPSLPISFVPVRIIRSMVSRTASGPRLVSLGQ